MFINFTNHPSRLWGEKQLAAAGEFGEIIDVAFPVVEPFASAEEVHSIALEYAEKIMGMGPDFVLCQGEFCLAYNVISALKAEGIKVGAACSERNVIEKAGPDGTEKTAIFNFIQFREY